jgi:Uma2 family endonuclease
MADMADVATRPASYSDLEAVPENLVAEIIDGALETHPRPRPRHARATARLTRQLTNRYEEGEGDHGGWIFMIEPELHLGPHVVVPDLAGWRAERLTAEPDDAFIDIEPDWVCEILSPSTVRLDRGAKRRIYADAGVGHLWLLDPLEGTLEAFALSGRNWLLLGTTQRGEVVHAAPFEAASFPLDDLLPFDAPPASSSPGV